VLLDLKARDARDSKRAAAPLRQADDAILLDTSDLSREDSIAEACRLVSEKLLANAHRG
jgi:cytidylate kinase